MQEVEETHEATKQIRKLRRRAKRMFTGGRSRPARKLCKRARRLAKASGGGR